MAVPKKYSRRIVVDGIAYRWRVPPEPNYDQGHFGGLWVTVWREDEPHHPLWLHGGARPDNLHGAVGVVITPRHVAEAIRACVARGWQRQPGLGIDFPHLEPEAT